MKSIFSERNNRNPHKNEGAEKKGTPFFSKENNTPFFNTTSGTTLQTKLTIGQSGDKFEKEADTVADSVVNKTNKPDIQNKEISSIQMESLSTPLDDERLGTAEQRMEEDKLIQEKPEIQLMEGGKEEEEEPLQMKSNNNPKTAGAGITEQIASKSGKGMSLPKSTKSEMESSFGSDFSGVNIHTDQEAMKMNKELGAQAFTNGQDIYFNSGKFNPESSEGKHLLAHELTHVVQQSK